MSGVALFIEGGGQFEKEKRVLRSGFDSFFQPLKRIAVERGKSFRIVACGSRDEAYNAFRNERRFEQETHSLLLVDSEEILTTGVKDHLVKREEHWELTAVPEPDLHVMTATMETWIVADPMALRSFYGQHFAAGRLPTHVNLEGEGLKAGYLPKSGGRHEGYATRCLPQDETCPKAPEPNESAHRSPSLLALQSSLSSPRGGASKLAQPRRQIPQRNDRIIA